MGWKSVAFFSFWDFTDQRVVNLVQKKSQHQMAIRERLLKGHETLTINFHDFPLLVSCSKALAYNIIMCRLRNIKIILGNKQFKRAASNLDHPSCVHITKSFKLPSCLRRTKTNLKRILNFFRTTSWSFFYLLLLPALPIYASWYFLSVLKTPAHPFLLE